MLLFRIIAGLIIAMLGGIGLEVAFYLAAYMPFCYPGLLDAGCSGLKIFEEFYETAGVTIILFGLLDYLAVRLDWARWRRLLTVILSGSALWTLSVVVIWVLLPVG